MLKADITSTFKSKSMNPPSMSFSSVFLPLQMTQTVLKKSPWRNVLPRSALSRTFSLEVSRPVHPVCGCAGRLLIYKRHRGKQGRYFCADITKIDYPHKLRISRKRISKHPKHYTKKYNTLVRMIRVTNRITPMSVRPQPKVQCKERAKTTETKSARHVHAISQHHELRIMAHARSNIQRQRDTQNHQPCSARSRNHPRDNAEHRVRNHKRPLRATHRRYKCSRSCGRLSNHR